MRPTLGLLLFASLLPSLALAVDPPTVAPGECLYLQGAPTGMPAATTEVTSTGSYIYDECDMDMHVEVGRDIPLQVQMWVVAPPLLARGCRVVAYADHAFTTVPEGAAWVTLAASGEVRGILHAHGQAWPIGLTLNLELIEEAPEGEVVRGSSLVYSHAVQGSNRLAEIDDAWSGSVSALIAHAGRFRARLSIVGDLSFAPRTLDFGAPGTLNGIRYTSMAACVIPQATSTATAAADMERDLYDKRCLPYLWLPAAHGGRLEDAMALMLGRIADAEGSGDPHANLALARERMGRAASEYARGEYQRSCRSTSDAIRALTTP